MKPLSCSMHLFREGEVKAAELGRKRYEELKKDLEGMGLRADIERDGATLIGVKDGKFATGDISHYRESRHGPLLAYNAPLLSAIAGQRPEGGVGTIYKANDLDVFVRLDRIELSTREWAHYSYVPSNVPETHSVPLKAFYSRHHLATIEELIEAFPPTCEENAQVEPEPRKIKKGDMCWDEYGVVCRAITDQYKSEIDGNEYVMIKDGPANPYLASRFTIANEEEPVKEETDPLRIRQGDDLIFDNTRYVPNSLTYFRQYKALSDEFDDDGQMFVWVVGNDGTKVACLSDCFTLASEVATKYKERTHIAIQVDRGTLELAIGEEGIYTSDEATDVTDFLRYALLRHDQMKQQ